VSPASAATVEFDHAAKSYPGTDEPAIRDLSLEVPPGKLTIFIGPSGSGKTTAMRLVNRMIELTSGDVRVDGVSVRDRPAAELRRGIGYAIQQIGLFPHLTVAENIGTVPKLLGWDHRRVSARVSELLDLVGLEQAMGKRYPAQISGGQRQRVGVARALAADPPLLLMDEPFGAIDPITRSRLQEEFRRLQTDLGKTVIFVTHDIDEALKLGDHIAVLKPGGVLAQYAAAEELVRSPADEFVEEFVGADRMIARLEWLMSVREEGRQR
jgi:osmoprotectant transport system ATP-binding protein